MSAAVESQRAMLVQGIKKHMPAYVAKHIEATIQGDAEAAFSFNVALDDCDRGVVAVALWRAKIALPAFRAFLAATWKHDHRHLIAAAETRRRLASMFRYAAFPLPDDLPDTVRVWRGTSKLSQAQSVRGYSWTTNKEVAYWFASRFASFNGNPLVLVADVAKSDIALFTNDRKEHEAVLLVPPKGWRVDSTASDFKVEGGAA
ncbi:hypothetical protein [Simplicispira psychrophila]|uniref:hypothetical protein n=1 Tax=Simplicispira psychrophila TaxID=80882 RepID=UPI00047FC9AE|nr:hypothetical protein [Simplicispira psychrophila]